MSDRPSRALAVIRITEERAWKVARWLMVGAIAFAGQYAPRVIEYAHELENLPSLRQSITQLERTTGEHETTTRELAARLRERTELDDFLFERLASFEAADFEPRRERKASASAYAVRMYRESRMHGSSPKEALLIARAARAP